jgi:hypothetical protein
VAAPFFDGKGMVTGSIAVAGSRQRFQGKALRLAAENVTREAQALSRALGFSGRGDLEADAEASQPGLIGSRERHRP